MSKLVSPGGAQQNFLLSLVSNQDQVPLLHAFTVPDAQSVPEIETVQVSDGPHEAAASAITTAAARRRTHPALGPDARAVNPRPLLDGARAPRRRPPRGLALASGGST
jgi:hypothetical protein